MSSITDDIREILLSHGQMSVAISTLDDDADLYQNGLTSHASVNVMLALENNFDIEFPIQCCENQRSSPWPPLPRPLKSWN